DGTVAVDDATLSGVTQLTNLTALGNKLYFTGYTYAAGYKLYAGSAAVSFAPAQAIANVSLSPKINDALAARLLTNPVKDQLKFTVNVKDQQSVQIMIADALGRTLVSDKQILSSGINM